MTPQEQRHRHRLRIERIQYGGNQFGHAGRHHGDGSPNCPRELHHHHDWFCMPPTLSEWAEAGRTGSVEWGSRA